MRQSIRALGWTVTISLLLLFTFLLTAGYSLFQTMMTDHGIAWGDSHMSAMNGAMVLSTPIAVNNTGYYDISEFKITTELKTLNGTTLTTNSTTIEEITRGEAESTSLIITLSLSDLLSNMTYLLHNDTEFKIDFTMGFNYAYAFGFQMELMNTSMPWGAPFYGLDITETGTPNVNGTHLLMDITLVFENHSFLDVDGILLLDAFNETGGYIGAGRIPITVPSNTQLSEPIAAAIELENLFHYTGTGSITVAFEHVFSVHPLELGRVSYG